MQKIITFLITLMGGILGFGICQGASPPMVEKHIFLAKPPSTEEKSSVADTRPVKARLIFTGVMISDQGRYALIEEKINKPGEKKKKIFTTGETVAGYTLKKIESNYIVLAQKDKDIKLNLYGSNKNRPPPPVEAAPPQAVAAKSPSSGTTANQKGQPSKGANAVTGNKKNSGQKGASASATNAAQPASKTKNENPLANALKKAVEKTKAGNVSKTSNPFLEAINKARQNSSQ